MQLKKHDDTYGRYRRPTVNETLRVSVTLTELSVTKILKIIKLTFLPLVYFFKKYLQ